MKPAPFEFLRAGSLEHACELLAAHGSEARLIAGGQSLVPMMAMRLVRPGLLIDLNDVETLKYVAVGEDSVRIGAGTRQASMAAHQGLATAVPLLRLALEFVGHEQTRNRGTLGGSLAHADPAAELPLVAVMLDATIRVHSQRDGPRPITARTFFAGPMATRLGHEDCITEVVFPIWSGPRCGAAFDEFSIRHGDFALVAACAQVRLDERGQCTAAALALGGVGPVPLDMSHHAVRLVGSALEDAAVDHVAHRAAAELEPHADLHASADYRRHLARVLAARVLRQARTRARDAAPAA